MGWELRNGRLYYYESRWVDGRVLRRYLGNGGDAKAAAQAVANRAERRTRAALEVARVKRELAELEAQTRQVRELTSNLLQASLLSQGFYQASYTWRKRKTKTWT